MSKALHLSTINMLLKLYSQTLNRLFEAILLLIIVCLLPIYSFSQSMKSIKRFEINAKRTDIGYTSKDALPRGREFKRLDSTYYVGWMYEGGYKFEHAADYIGFKNAAYDLQRALDLMQKDFNKEISLRTSDVMSYLQVMQYHRDWDFTAYALVNCYSNMDLPNEIWTVLQRCKKMDLQDEQYLECYHSMSWTVHRNRYYTSEKASFLKNNIDDNEKYANSLLDSSVLKIKRDADINAKLFTTNYVEEKMPSVWHYKSILYTYQLDIENGQSYYDKLKATPYFPANNYATFTSVQAKFGEARVFYDIAKEQDQGDKRLKESYYYLSILNQYANHNKDGISELNDVIKANGSTPGFGWYNIALARNYLYRGDIFSAKKFALRAQQFKEIHIGTTLGQGHYDFTVMLMNLIIKKREIEAIRFRNKRWWLNPASLFNMAKLNIEKYGLQFLIINQFASNPERDRVIYKIFSTESTVSFDEIYELIDGFSTQYFLQRFQEDISQESRYHVKRYCKYFTAKLLIKKGKYHEAKSYLESILNEMLIDVENEKLLIARTNEALAICERELNKPDAAQDYLQEVFAIYPQLIPFTDIPVKIYLTHNANNAKEQKMINDLKKYNIDFVEESETGMPLVNIDFQSKIDKISVSTTIQDKNDSRIGSFSYSGKGKIAAYTISNIIFNIR